MKLHEGGGGLEFHKTKKAQDELSLPVPEQMGEYIISPHKERSVRGGAAPHAVAKRWTSQRASEMQNLST